jgi:plastocyanin
MNRVGLIALGAALAAALGCSYGGATDNGYDGGGNKPGNQNPPTQPGGTPAQTASVEVRDDFFSPNSTLLAAGGTVTWTWIGVDGHSVTPTGSTSFSPEAPVSYPPKTLVVTFPSAGDYNYLCTVHGVGNGYNNGTMIGAVYVR